MILYEPDDPLVLNGTYDVEGYKPGERAHIAKAKARQTKGPTAMAKKKTTHRVNRHSARGGRSTSTEVAPAGGKKKRPRARPLPGMENVRILELDEAAASISEIREQMNALRQDEGGHLKNALALMREHKKTAWRHAGVELVRVPGEEKLRVRTSKEQATAEVEEPEEEHVEASADGEDGDQGIEPEDMTGEELAPGVEAEH